MVFGVYSIKDDCSTFLNPTCSISDASAIREFKVTLDDAKNQIMHFNKGDFSLYRIGDFDSETGLLISYVAPKVLYRGSEKGE